MQELDNLALLLEQGQMQSVTTLTQQLLDAGIPPQVILNEGLIAGMAVVGKKMRDGEMYLPEVLQAAGAMQAALKLLKPHLLRDGVPSRGTVLIGTVKGDMHDIGKNLVATMLQGAGFDIIDLGVNVSPEKFVQAVEAHKPAIVGLSAMLTTTMLTMKPTIEALRAAGSDVKVIVGGAPVNQNFADQIGADGFARDAVLAVERVKQLIDIVP
jgi:5-methyltetrahydrofolate--homocysteine methyltransferase